jgi:hypothetical protein
MNSIMSEVSEKVKLDENTPIIQYKIASLKFKKIAFEYLKKEAWVSKCYTRRNETAYDVEKDVAKALGRLQVNLNLKYDFDSSKYSRLTKSEKALREFNKQYSWNAKEAELLRWNAANLFNEAAVNKMYQIYLEEIDEQLEKLEAGEDVRCWYIRHHNC